MKAFLLIIRNQLPLFCGPKDGGKYDLGDACPVCGTGARRIDPIKLPLSRLKDRVSITLKHEVVIPPRLVSAIREIAPQCLREIYNEKTGTPTAFFQLVPETILPPWGNATTGWNTSKLDPPCPICKRDGFFNIPKVSLNLSYDKPILAFSMAATWEHFGKSRLSPDFNKSLFAVPLLIINESIKKALENEPGVIFVSIKTSHSEGRCYRPN
jgi:hypothetical protein